MTTPYTSPIPDFGAVGRYSDLAVHLRASDLSVNGMRAVPTPSYQRTTESLGRDSRGVIYAFPQRQPAIEYFDLDADGVFETPTLCFDGARTNLVPRGSDLSLWTAVNTPTVTSVPGLGDLPLWKIDDANAVNNAYVASPQLTARVTAAGNGVALFTIAKGDVVPAAGHELIVRDTTNSVNRAQINVQWAGTTPSTTPNAGSVLWQRIKGVTRGGKVVWEIAVKVTGTLTTADLVLWVRPSATATQTGDVYAGPAHFEDWGTYPLPLVLNPGASSATYSQDEWSIPIDMYCGPFAFWYDGIELGTLLHDGTRLLSLGNAAAANPEIKVDVFGGKYRLLHHNGTSSVSCALTGVAMPSVGERFQLYGLVDADGSCQLSIRVGTQPQVAGTKSAALAFAQLTGWAGWPGSAKLYVAPTYVNRQATRLIELKASVGAQSQAALVGAFG